MILDFSIAQSNDLDYALNPADGSILGIDW